MLEELRTLDALDDEPGRLETELAGTLVELSTNELVDDGGSISDTSTGHTSASTPPIVMTEQLLKGADGKPA